MPAFGTPAPIELEIELVVGDVHIIASDREDTDVVVRPTDPDREVDVDAAARTRVEYAEGRLLVRGSKGRGMAGYLGFGGRSLGSVVVVIEVPSGSAVQGDGGVVRWRADGCLGDVQLRTGAGDIRLDHAGPTVVTMGTGDVTVEHVNGDARLTTAGELRVGSVEGNAELKNLNGRTWIGEVTGRLHVKSANGAIVVDRAAADVVATTANGGIRLGEVVRGSATLETASGALEVGVRAGTAAWVDARSRFGRVTNTLERTDGPGDSDDSIEVRARTSFGAITLRRATTTPEPGEPPVSPS